jgi:hypothetical protein
MTIVGKSNPILELLKGQSPSSQGLAVSELSAATNFQDIISLLGSKPELSLSNVTGIVASNSPDVSPNDQILTAQMLQKFFASDVIDPSDVAFEQALKQNQPLAHKFVELLKQEIGLTDVDATKLLLSNADQQQPRHNILLALISDGLSEQSSIQKPKMDNNISTKNSFGLPDSFSLHEASKNLFRGIPKIEANLNLAEAPASVKYVMQFEPLLKELPSSVSNFTTAKLFVGQPHEKTGEQSNLSFLKVDIKIEPSLISVTTLSDRDIYNNKVIKNEGFSNQKSIILDLDISKINAVLTSIEFDGIDPVHNNNLPELNINFSRTGQNGIVNFSARSKQPSDVIETAVRQIVIDRSHLAVATQEGLESGVLSEGPAISHYASTLINTDESASGIPLKTISLNNDTTQQLLANINSVISGEYGLKQLHKIIKEDFTQDQAIKNLTKLVNETSLTAPVFTKISQKVKLLTTTADVLKMRKTWQLVDKKTFPIKNLPDLVMDQLDSKINLINGYVDFESKKVNFENPSMRHSIQPDDTRRSDGSVLFKLNQTVSSITGDPSRVQHTNLLQNLTPNFLSLYDAKIGSRLGMMLAEQVLNGKENFEIQLEPESFGKVRVNVILENSSIDIKMLTENSAALSVLRSSEGILQNIAEQNGLKLSDYSVDMQNNNQAGDDKNRQDFKSEKGQNLLEDIEINSDHLSQFDENSNSLNLLA